VDSENYSLDSENYSGGDCCRGGFGSCWPYITIQPRVKPISSYPALKAFFVVD
jgi:hypothetical protein